MRMMNKLMTNKVFKVFMAVVLAIGLSIPTSLLNTAKASAETGQQHPVSFNIDNLTASVGDISHDIAYEGTDYEVSFTAPLGYKVPDDIDISVEYQTLDSSKYTYTRTSDTEATLKIDGSAIVGQVMISMQGMQNVRNNGTTNKNGKVVVNHYDNGWIIFEVKVNDSVVEGAEVFYEHENNGFWLDVPGADDSSKVEVKLTSYSDGSAISNMPIRVEGIENGSGTTNAEGVFTKAAASAEPATYNVKFDLSNATVSGADTATAGTDYSTNITAEDGYELPDQIEIRIGDSQTALDSSKYTYTKSSETEATLVIKAEAITGYITLTVVATQTIGMTGYTDDDGKVQIKNPSDYTISTIEVKIGGEAALGLPVMSDGATLMIGISGDDKDKQVDVLVTDSAQGTTIANQEIWIVIADSESEELEIVAQGTTNGAGMFTTATQTPDPTTYSVNLTLTGATVAGAEKATEGSDYEATITANDGYVLPDQIEIKIGDSQTALDSTKYTYTKTSDTTATLKIDSSAITGEIKLQVSAPEAVKSDGATDSEGKVTIKDSTTNQKMTVQVKIDDKVVENIAVEVADGTLNVVVPEADKDKKIEVAVVDATTGEFVENESVNIMDSNKVVIISGKTSAGGVFTKADTTTPVETTNTTVSGIGNAVVYIDGKQVKDGDKLTLEAGKTYTIQWSPMAAGNDVTFLNTVVINGATIVSAYNSIDKSTWTEDNALYNKIMGQSGNKMVTLSRVEASVQTVQFVAEENNELQFSWVETAPVYRMYNTITSEHLFSTNKTEYDNFLKSAEAGQDYWVGEGIDWFSTVGENDATVYRLYNAALGAMGRSSHYYTTDEAEVKTLTGSAGWVLDGAENYFKSSGDVSIFTAYSENLGSAHFYTSSYDEWNSLDSGWDKEDAKNGVTAEVKSATGFFKAWISGKIA